MVAVTALRDGGSPWLVRLRRAEGEYGVVLRVGGGTGLEGLRTEVAALRLATEHGLPAPPLVAADLDGDPPRVLVGQVAGASAIPVDRPQRRLRALGAAAAALHAVPLAASDALPYREHPIAGFDFAALRRQSPPVPLLVAAEQRIAGYRPQLGDGVLVHGDLWQGNAMFVGDELAGLIDWDCAGVGAPGVDLGSLRCDAALCFGVPAADDVTAGWQAATGRPAADVAYWDVVAALSTPPDMGWFTAAISGQGRPDLDQPTLLQRRNEFLTAALDRLATTAA